MPQQDYVFLCTTVSDNESYLKKLHHILNPNTLVVSLQNGINFEEPIFKAIQPNNLLSGTCWIKISKLNPTQIRHDFGLKILLGEYPACSTNSIVSSEFDAFKTLMDSAGFELEVVDHYLNPQLTKLAINLPFFGLMLRYQIKQAKVVIEHLEELLKLQVEINSIGIELGINIDNDYVKEINAQLKQLPEANLSLEEKERLFKEVKPNFESFFAFLDSKNIVYPKLLWLYNPKKSSQSLSCHLNSA